MIKNLVTIIYMLIMLGIVIITNTVLGVMLANKKSKFSWEKLFKGLLKSLIIALCVLSFCMTLELVPIILARINIDVPTDVVTVMEIVMITLTAYKKYVTDCIEKFKVILKIKESE